METGQESNIISNFNSFAERRSILSIVFFNDKAQIAWRLPEEDVWSEVVSIPFSTQAISVEQVHRVKKFTESYQIGRNQAYIAISSKDYAIIPEELFLPNRKAEYLVKNTGLGADKIGSVLSAPCEMINSVFVFHVPTVLDHFLNNHFPGMHLLHEKQSLVAAALNMPSSKTVTINFCGNHFDLLFQDGKKLNFFNSFQLISSEDVLYYLLFVAEKLGSNIRDFNVRIFGKIPSIIDREQLLKYLPSVKNFEASDEFHSLKKLPECGL